MSYDEDDDVDELFDRAKSHYRIASERERARIRSDEDHAYNWTQAVIGFLAAILNFFATVWHSCCYITTAVTRHFGLVDNCRYLTVLRQFRDQYIVNGNDEQRLADLKQYYTLAPQVIDWVNCQPNPDIIWSHLAETVVAAVAAIDAGDYTLAYELYRSRILSYQEKIKGEQS
jgi:hypothetical protein